MFLSTRVRFFPETLQTVNMLSRAELTHEHAQFVHLIEDMLFFACLEKPIFFIELMEPK